VNTNSVWNAAPVCACMRACACVYISIFPLQLLYVVRILNVY